MLENRTKNLQREFAYWIWGGVGILVVVVIFLWVRSSNCKPPHNVWTAYGHEHTNPYQEGSKRFSFTFSGGVENTNSKKGEPKTEDRNYLPEELCFEVKFGDLAIAFFTYCLVIVGWFSMRSTDETTKRGERAYIVFGALVGVPKIDSDEATRQLMPSATQFKGPWRMALYNFGKTAGYTVLAQWGICPKHEFEQANASVSDIISRTCKNATTRIFSGMEALKRWCGTHRTRTILV